MGGTGVATLVKTSMRTAEAVAHGPLGLGCSGLPSHGPGGVVPRPPAQHRLARQWTTAKPGLHESGDGGVACGALPFFLDVSLFAPPVDFTNAVNASADEIVFQATLQVPAHHALACRMAAYGTPFAAPDLQAAAHELGDNDLEFAACLASPPDLEEQPSANFGRVMSLLDRHQQQGTATVTPAAAARGTAQQPGASPAQQVLRSTPGASQQQAAPKVLVSVDDAESGAAQLQRQSSAKKPRSGLAAVYGKRALEAMLGLGYLLSLLHEKSLGGRLQFSAGITAAMSPQMSDGHVRPRSSSSGLANVPSAVLAGLRGMLECPSLSPRFSGLSRRTTGSVGPGGSTLAASSADGAAAAAAAGASAAAATAATQLPGSPRLVRGQPASFEAAWDRVLHPGTPTAAAAMSGSPLCSSLQVQMSLSAPRHRRASASTEGATPTAAGALLDAASGSTAFVATPASPWSRAAQQQQLLDADLLLHKTEAMGHDSSSSPDTAAALDAAILEVQSSELSGPFAVAAKESAERALGAAGANGVASHLLADQDDLTSPMAAAAGPRNSGGGGGSAPGTPGRMLRPVMSVRLTLGQPAWQFGGGSAAQTAAPQASPAAAPAQQQQQQQEAARPGPVHMHQYSQQDSVAAQLSRAAAAARASQPSFSAGVGKGEAAAGSPTMQAMSPMSISAPHGLWPTMSFSLVPVRLGPARGGGGGVGSNSPATAGVGAAPCFAT